jgi:hypothetical protein
VSHRARAVLLALLLIAPLGVADRVDAAGGPLVAPERPRGRPGATVLVRVEGWQPGSVVTVVLCGNDARRGSQDCDLVSGQSVHARTSRAEHVELPVALPPAPCPCVVRASDVASLVVVTAPFEVVGAPTAPTVGPTSAVAAIPLTVVAHLHQRRGSFLDRLRRVLGGPSHRELVLELHSTSSYPQAGVVVTAAFGRHATGGAPLDGPDAIDLAPGERRSITIPLELEAPVHGRYVVAGSVFTAGQAVRFSATVDAAPWGLIVLALLVALAVLAAAVVALRKRQMRARRPSGGDGEHSMTGSRTLGEHPLADPAPEQPVS